MTRFVERLRDERGVAMVLAVFGTALLATLSVVVVDTVTSESTRSTKANVRQSSFEAAEAGIDDYIAKLADDRSYYLHWVHPAESSRRDTGSGTVVSASGSSPAPSTWCRDPKTRPAPTAWAYGASWTSQNGKDHWCSLGNGYEYNIQITPPSQATGQKGVTILATGRPIAAAGQANVVGDSRVLEAIVKQSSITDFQEIADGSIGWGTGATSYGLIYSNHDISWSSGTTAYGSNFAMGSISGNPSRPTNAPFFDKDSSTAWTDPLQPPSPLTQPIDFSSFLASFTDIASAANDTTGGGIYLGTSYNAWRLTFNAAGTVTVEGCALTNIESKTTSPTCTLISTKNMPTNGAIYSENSVIVQGTVKGRVTVATPNNIIIGGNLLYQGDTDFLNPSYGNNVLGLEAEGPIVVPCWITGNLDWRAALLSEYDTFGAWGNGFTTGASCSNSPTSGNLMRHRGSSALDHGGSFSNWFDNRDYRYDDSLPYLAPPWFPTIDPNYVIQSFRELKPG